MTKYIHVKLTEDQANTIYNVLEWAYDYDNEIDKEQQRYHAYITRLRTKIRKAMVSSRLVK